MSGRCLAFLFILSTACIPTMDERRPLTIEKGAKDLQCEPSKLTSKLIAHRLFHVEGCGKRAIYRVICKIGVSSCYLLGGPKWAKDPSFAARR